MKRILLALLIGGYIALISFDSGRTAITGSLLFLGALVVFVVSLTGTVFLSRNMVSAEFLGSLKRSDANWDAIADALLKVGGLLLLLFVALNSALFLLASLGKVLLLFDGGRFDEWFWRDGLNDVTAWTPVTFRIAILGAPIAFVGLVMRLVSAHGFFVRWLCLLGGALVSGISWFLFVFR